MKLKNKFISCFVAATIAITSIFTTNTPVDVRAADDCYDVSVSTYSFTMQGNVAKSTANNLIYYAEVPLADNFIDYMGHLNMAYFYDGTVYVKRMDSHYNEIDELAFSLPMEQFGAISCDKDGNYYVVSAVSTLDDEAYTDDVMTITKYDYDGTKVVEKSYSASETCPYGWITGDDMNKWLTKTPFDAGSCDLAISDNGVLACNYARKMFSNHQSNFIFYVDTDTLEMKDKGSVPYASHSFNQRIIALSDNTFLDLEHGDSYNRGFMLMLSGEKSGTYQTISDSGYTPFHFREGANRAYGYNETFAQMGSLIEIDGGAAYCATSEKTLSLTAAPSTTYYGHNEARNVFVQIFNIENNTFSTVGGETRTAVDEVTEDEATELKLSGDEVDDGVIWLTDYEDDYWAANSRIVNVGDYLVVLWEKLYYTSDFYGNSDVSDGTYYAVLDLQGNILKQPEKFGEMELPSNYDVVTDGKNIFFATTDGTDEIKLNVVTLNFNALENVSGVAGHQIYVTEAVEATCGSDGCTEGRYCMECDDYIETPSVIEKTGNHTWDNGEITKEPDCTKKGEKTYTCTLCGETKTEEISETGHTIVTDEALKATCKSEGLTEGSHCAVCGKILVSQTVTAKTTAHSYKTTVTKATASKDGVITKKCSICGATQTAKIARIKSVTISTKKYTYNGKAKKPTVTIKDSDGKKISAANYTIKYTNNKSVGKAVVTVTMKGNYSGTYKLSFNIVPKKTIISKLTPISKGFKVTLKKQSTETTGYEIRYRLKGSKKWTVKKLTKTSITLKKLKSKKSYQIQVRTYKKIGKTYYYSAWSKTKTVKTKK